jgi:1-acyl-sn-glycerol-3-phosphate acyltransferase
LFRARFRLASLWLSQVARVLADNCLRIFVVLEIAKAGLKEQDAAWHQVTPFYYLPFILFAPVNGILGNGLPKRWVLMGSAVFCLAVTAVLGAELGMKSGPWLWCGAVGLVMIGGAIYSPARYALLPAAAHDTHLPLSRVNGLIEMGGSVAVVAGLVLGLHLHDPSALATQRWWILLDWSKLGIPPALAALILVNLICLVAAVPVNFPSDVSRPEPVGRAIRGFFQDCRRIWREKDARGSLLMLAIFWGLAITGTGVMFVYTGGLKSAAGKGELMKAMILTALGTAAGAGLAGLQGHPRRALGLVPFAGTGMLAVLAWTVAGTGDLGWPCVALGIMAGLVIVPLRAAFQGAVPADARGNALAVSNTANYLAAIVLALPIFGLARLQLLDVTGLIWLVAGLAALAALAAWWLLYRDFLELFIEFLIWPVYRIRDHGPGLEDFPSRGPAIVVANHSAWLDPVWLAKVLPRRLTPMMTSVFYDMPVLRWLMIRVVHAIRVEASEFRREAPELKQAIDALDRGECLVIFPEGRMRRRDDQLLQRFGQGVWHILRERPATPVVACWIEGGWGSCFSYFGGPPLTKKKWDFWRHIDVAVSEPRVLDPAILADHRTTRAYLMEACLNARSYSGLEIPKAPTEIEEEPVAKN